MSRLSIILPAFNEEESILYSYSLLSNELSNINLDAEIIYINDGSTDNTWGEIRSLVSSYDNVKGICFSRNFGKEAAIFAGLEISSGDCAIVMDL